MIRTLALALVVGLAATACTKKEADVDFKPAAITPFFEDAVLGQANAPVTVIEYASTTCIHCFDFHKTVFPQLKSKYIDTGKVKMIYRVMPTAPAEISIAGAAIARCAGPDKYFDTIGDLFDTQEALMNAAQAGKGVIDLLVQVGERHGLTRDQVGTCIGDPAIRTHLENGVREAPAFVDSTPTLIVDGVEVEDHSIDSLSAAIDAKLAAPAPAPSPAP